jgi:hypothetical protein
MAGYGMKAGYYPQAVFMVDVAPHRGRPSWEMGALAQAEGRVRSEVLTNPNGAKPAAAQPRSEGLQASHRTIVIGSSVIGSCPSFYERQVICQSRRTWLLRNEMGPMLRLSPDILQVNT